MKYCLTLANVHKLTKVRGGSYRQSLWRKKSLCSRLPSTAWELFKIPCWTASTEPKA